MLLRCGCAPFYLKLSQPRAQAGRSVSLRNRRMQVIARNLEQATADLVRIVRRQGRLLLGISLKIIQSFGAGIEMENQLIALVANHKHPGPAAILRAEGICATCNTLSNGRIVPSGTFAYFAPHALSLK